MTSSTCRLPAAERVLFVRLRSLGDVVLMTPALHVARRAGAKVGVVVESPFDQILQGNSDVDRMFVPTGRGKWASRVRVVRQIRDFAPDLVIDLHGGSTSSLITRLAGARERVGYESSPHAGLYTQCVPDPRKVWGKERLHTVEHQLTPLKYLGWPVDPLPPLRVDVSPIARRKLQESMVDRLSEEFILLHPAAAFDTKQWPISNFASLARELVGAGYHVIVTAGPGQEDLLNDMVVRCPEGTTIVDPLPLPDFVALVSLCKLYIGNDTGPTHIAAALKKPIVVIFGSSDAGAWFPWQTRHRLLQSDLDCIPCPGYTCLHYDRPRCIESISVRSALKDALELLRLENEEQYAC